MNPHPRLYTTRAELARLRESSDLPLLRSAAAALARQAEEYASSLALTYEPGVHNALLNRAREMQGRVVTLLVRWRQTGEARFRAAAMDHLRAMASWEHWSWDAWLYSDPVFDHWYDLSYGENALTLALAYDWLHDTLDAEERRLLVEQARVRGLEPFVNVVETRPSPAGYLQGTWFGSATSNWNTVCAGGAGMLALAMHEEFPALADRVLALAEDSMRPYFEGLRGTNGGWVEGIGYWNYGHCYGFRYLLSHENATGRPHPFLALPGVRETLSFPMDFAPNGQFCSFPDVNTWSPMAWHYKAAVHLGRSELIPLLDTYPREFGNGGWPEAAEFLTLHPRSSPAATAGPALPGGEVVARIYPAMDWAILADRLPEPRLYMAIRGGSTDDPHAMVDVLSFQVVVGREKLIHNYSNEGGEAYMHTTFSQRRNDIFENSQPAKNVPIINGVGLPDHARVDTQPVTVGGHRGFRLESTRAYGELWPDKPMVEFAARLFLMLGTDAFLIVDRIELPQTGRAEVRMHSFAELEAREAGFLLRGKRETLRVVYTCDVPANTATAVACPTRPERGANVLRWCTLSRTHRQITMATLLVPGEAPAELRLRGGGERLRVQASGGDWRSEFELSPHLESVAAG